MDYDNEQERERERERQEIEEGMAEERNMRESMIREFMRTHRYLCDTEEALREEAEAYASNCL